MKLDDKFIFKIKYFKFDKFKYYFLYKTLFFLIRKSKTSVGHREYYCFALLDLDLDPGSY